MNFTISDLKKHLGPGLGLRKNKYLLELPIPGIQGESLNILCRSAGLPEYNITTTQTFHKGRKYIMRAETDFPGTYEISLVDDSRMKVRESFDNWMKAVDDTKPKDSGILGASFEELAPGLLGNVKDGLAVANTIKSTLETEGGVEGFVLGLLGGGGISASYQTDINIWQLDAQGEKVRGYKLQNAFPSSVGIVTLEDGDENTLSEFSVTLSYSEFIPLVNQSFGESLLGIVAGDDLTDIASGVENLFD